MTQQERRGPWALYGGGQILLLCPGVVALPHWAGVGTRKGLHSFPGAEVTNDLTGRLSDTGSFRHSCGGLTSGVKGWASCISPRL